jgi:DNA-binding MarR family transcriptional regulator
MPRKSKVQEEIRQARPFRSRRQEGTIALLRTASVVGRGLARVLEPFQLSLAQYNALRIVRGAGQAGIPTLAIRERMIEEGTTITRVLDKLEAAGLVRRERSEPDRRQVVCRATTEGADLLDVLDPLVDEADADAMAVLGERELDQLIRVLDRLREANAEKGAPRAAARRG